MDGTLRARFLTGSLLSTDRYHLSFSTATGTLIGGGPTEKMAFWRGTRGGHPLPMLMPPPPPQ